MTKEFLEQWIVQGMNLESIGAGNFPIDVYSPNDYGIDVKFAVHGIITLIINNIAKVKNVKMSMKKDIIAQDSSER